MSACRTQHNNTNCIYIYIYIYIVIYLYHVRTAQSGIGNCVSSAMAVKGIVNPNDVQPSGYYMYHQLNIQKFYILPTQCIYVFCMDLNTNMDCFPIQH